MIQSQAPNPRQRRVTALSHGLYQVAWLEAPLAAGDPVPEVLPLTGAFHRAIRLGQERYPVLGDLVELENSGQRIGALVPARNIFSRAMPGEDYRDQILAANLDRLYLVMGLDRDYNENRLERYITVAQIQGLEFWIILTKRDLCPDFQPRLAQVRALSPTSPIFCTDAPAGQGLEGVLEGLAPGSFAYLAGSSGAGKSTLMNALFGRQVRQVGQVREDDGRGRHTSSDRRAFLHPAGIWLADSPGLREIGLPGEDSSSLASGGASLDYRCRFSDCSHQNEPGCGVLAALAAGQIDQKRYRQILQLVQEAQGRSQNLQEARRQRDKTIARYSREIQSSPKRRRD